MTLTLLTVGSFLASIPAGLYALIGTLFGGVMLKVTEHYLAQNRTKADNRRDLNAEITELLNRVDKLEEEVTEWRGKYYNQQEEISTLRRHIIDNGGTPPVKQ